MAVANTVTDADPTPAAAYRDAGAAGMRQGAARGAGQIGGLQIEGLSVAYGAHRALSDFRLDVAGREFIALLGPSGCGKTTLLNCLAGFLSPSSGSIVVDGRRIDRLPPEERGFGMVFQNYALFPHLTVARNVAFGLECRKLPRAEIEHKVERALGHVRLNDQAHKHPHQLSGGQQQRVALARAIVLEPPLMLMDEPLSNLDAQLRGQLRTELRRLHQELGLTTIYVTHDRAEALSLADRIVILRGGRMLQVGTPEQVYSTPAGAFVAAFMGYTNAIPVEITSRAHGRATCALAGGQATLVGTDRTGGGSVGSFIAALRPEHVRLRSAHGRVPGPDDVNIVEAVVEVVEYEGEEFTVEAVLSATPSGQRLQFRTRERLKPGERVSLRIDPADLLVFDSAS